MDFIIRSRSRNKGFNEIKIKGEKKMNNIIEFLKTNKGLVIKRVLIVGGALAGLVLVGGLLMKKEGDNEELFDEEIEDEV